MTALNMGNYWIYLCNYYTCGNMVGTSTFYLLEIIFIKNSKSVHL